MKTSRVCFAALAVAVCWNAAARAEFVLVSNLSEPPRDDTPIANPEFWAAQSFFPDTNAYLLSSIEAIVGNGANSPQVVAELRKADVNGDIDVTAGGLLPTFTAPDMSGPTSVRSFAPDNPVALLPVQKYWFLLGSSNAGTYDWSYANTGLYAGPGSLGDFADSSDAGATWTRRDSPYFPYLIQVNTNAIPEPNAIILVTIGLALLPLKPAGRRFER
jgi:hypothetical protein